MAFIKNGVHGQFKLKKICAVVSRLVFVTVECIFSLYSASAACL